MKKEHSFRLACISTPPFWAVFGDVLIGALIVGCTLAIVIMLFSKKITLRKTKVKIALVVLGVFLFGLVWIFLSGIGIGYLSLVWRIFFEFHPPPGIMTSDC